MAWAAVRSKVMVFLLSIYAPVIFTSCTYRESGGMTGLMSGNTAFADHLCYLCLVFVMLSGLFIAACHLLGQG